MTLCNSGPDIVPNRKVRTSEIRSSRRRSRDRPPLHPMAELNMDSHKSDNRHYYHHHRRNCGSHMVYRHHHSGRHDDSNNDNNNNRTSHILDDRNNINSSYDEVDGPVIAREIEAIENNHNRSNNNNGPNGEPDLIIPRISIQPDQDASYALSTNDNSNSMPNHQGSHNHSLDDSFHGNGTSHDNNPQNEHVPEQEGGHASRGRLMVLHSHNQRDRSASSRRSSPRPIARDMSPGRQNGVSGHDDIDHELTKDLVQALRSIGDNLDAKIKDHHEPSVQAVFGSRKFQLLCVGQFVRETLRQYKVLGVAVGVSLELLQQYNRV